jgi:hypothetical protein
VNVRTRLIKLVTFLGGIYFFLEFVLPGTVFGVKVDTYHDQISNGFITIGAMAAGLGLINLIMQHGSKIIFRRREWVYSAALLSGLAIMIVVTGQDWSGTRRIAGEVGEISRLSDFAERIESDHEKQVEGVLPAAARNGKLKEAAARLLARIEGEMAVFDLDRFGAGSIDHGLAQGHLAAAGAGTGAVRAALGKLTATDVVDLAGNGAVAGALKSLADSWRNLRNLEYEHSNAKHVYRLLFEGLFVSLGSAMFSLLGFYIAAAAYRAFRIRSAESSLMMIAAVLVMLGQIPFGVWIWSGLPDVRLWLLEIPNSAAFRAITFGAGVAGLVMAFRMWLSIESESFDGEER